MVCDICGRTSCCVSFHSFEEQDLFAPVIELFEKARDLRTKIKNEIQEDLTDPTVEEDDSYLEDILIDRFDDISNYDPTGKRIL